MIEWIRKLSRAAKKAAQGIGLIGQAADSFSDAIGEFSHDDPKKPQSGMPPRPIDLPDDPADRL